MNLRLISLKNAQLSFLLAKKLVFLPACFIGHISVIITPAFYQLQIYSFWFAVKPTPHTFWVSRLFFCTKST